MAEFPGRIVRSSPSAATAASGVNGTHEVWFPVSREEVATAVALSKNKKIVVKSGTQASAASDVVDLADGVVLNLAGLSKIEVSDGIVKTEVAATTRSVARALAERGLALPLGDNPLRSIASHLARESPSCLSRTLGPLSDYVTGLEVVTPEGRLETRSGSPASTLSRGVDVITDVSFRTASASNLWMFKKSFPYPGKEAFAALAKALLVKDKIPKHADLALDASSSRYDVPIVKIIAVGREAGDEATLRSHVDQVLAGLGIDLGNKRSEERWSGVEVVRAVAESGLSIASDPRVDTNRVHRIVAASEDLGQALNLLSEEVDRGIAFHDDGSGMRDPNLRLSIRLQLNRDDLLEVTGLKFTPREATPSASPESPRVRTAEAAPAPRALDFGEASRIPGFKGEIHLPTDWWFRWYADQYATSSYPRDRMTPFMVAYPLDAADVKAAIAFAKAHGKRIVARSGGHQYSGLSSGGSETIVLAMDAFDRFEVDGNIVEVGPAVPLTELAARFKEHGITIPHGECPTVCIGGHAQTGGYGHLRPGFGLALDHVTAFTIVLADGTERTVHRPDGPPTTPDEELFWGVLGGNAGSFGVVLNYRIECIKDEDHPNSYGYTAARWYDKGRYLALMKEVQEWTRRVVDDTLPPDLNFSMSVESNSGLIPHPVLLVELLHMNLGGAGQVVDGDEVFKSIIEKIDDGPPSLMDLVTISGPKSLSALSDAAVRRYPLTTLDGREFAYPYKKRLNSTTNALTDAFVTAFVDYVDKVVTDTEGVYLVYQMMIGGGNFRSTPRRAETSIPRRDFVFGFSLYLFYADGYEEEAQRLQDELGKMLVATGFSDPEQRIFWGTFGDTDLSKPSVRDFYYDDLAAYSRLQALKKRVDPGDVFHTPLTVKLPGD